MNTPHPLTGRRVTVVNQRGGDPVGDTGLRLAADVTYTGTLLSVDDDGGAEICCPDITGAPLYVWPALEIVEATA